MCKLCEALHSTQVEGGAPESSNSSLTIHSLVKKKPKF